MQNREQNAVFYSNSYINLQENWKTTLIPSSWNQHYLFKEKQYFEETKKYKKKKKVKASVTSKQTKLALQNSRNLGEKINNV